MPSCQSPPERAFVSESRPHDFLYDPSYILPSRENFLKDAARGAMSGARVKIRTVFESMFSDLKNDRRIEPCLTLPKPSPMDNFLPQYEIAGLPIIPMDNNCGAGDAGLDWDVTGSQRFKYGLKYLSSTSYHLQPEVFDFNKLAPDEKKKILQTQKTQRSGFVSRGMQTETREIETQTDPYSPPHKLANPASYPKVLALMKLTWGKGLPFTLEDIVVIERALSKRILEHSERSDDDVKGFDQRIKLMEDLEAQQWADREKELEKILQLKMELTTKLLEDYNDRISNEHTLRLERLQVTLRHKNVKHLENVKHQYFRNLRKLEKKYFGKKDSKAKRNIIRDYTEFDSAVYAPLVRDGAARTLLNPPPPFQFDLHRDFEGFQKLTESKSFKKELNFDIKAFKKRVKKCQLTNAEQRLERKLEKIYTTFKDHHPPKHHHHHFNANDPNALFQLEGKLSAPIISLQDEEGFRRPHCVTLQKIARGRVVQQMVRKEIEENMNELLAMKAMYDLDPNLRQLDEGQMSQLIATKKAAEAGSVEDPEVKEVLGHLEGETLGKMLDFLDKEMIRLIDERKIHALILIAERERRRKEALEAGRRYREEEQRRFNDEVFRQVVGISQATVDIYLEDIYIESSDRTADETSRQLIRQMAATLNEAEYSLPTELGSFEKEELAAELVSGFMIPELSRQTHQEKLEVIKGRYKKAASQVLDAVFSTFDILDQIVTDQIPPYAEKHLEAGSAAGDGAVTAVDDMIKSAVAQVLKFQDDVDATVLDCDPTTAPTTSAGLERFYPDPALVVSDEFKAKLAAKSLELDIDFDSCDNVETIYSSLKDALKDIFGEARKVALPDSEDKPEDEREKDDEEDTDW